MNWQLDKARADDFTPQLEKIIRLMAGEIIDVRIATDDEDQHHATDLVFEVAAGGIACRVRFDCPWRDLTIRSWRATGARTELDKFLTEDFPPWYLYAWINAGRVDEWIWVDNHKLVESGLLDTAEERDNRDGTRFKAVSIPRLQLSGCLVHHAKRDPDAVAA